MKIRILGNSIRLRLSQTEVQHLSEKGKVEEQTQFGLAPNSVLIYSILRKETPTIHAAYSDNYIQIFLPNQMASDWAASDEVGLENHMPLGDGNALHILIEKDFKCLTERSEDESDLFPNPNESC